MARPLVSVLVTVYNREAYLGETLESILSSTWKEMEVHVVDDGSTDNSVAIAERKAKKDNRIQVHVNSRNQGDYPNRMKAASLARGRYIKYVDSDDLLYPHSLAIMVESMERFPEAALGLSHSMPQDESPYPWCLTPQDAFRKHFLGRGCMSCGPSSAIMRRDAFESIGGFRLEWNVISDTDLWYRMAARWPVVLLPPALIWWRRHEQQEFARGDSETVYLQRGYEVITQALKAQDCPLSDSERDAGLDRARQHFARKLLSLALHRRKFRLAVNMFKDSDLSAGDLKKGFRRYR